MRPLGKLEEALTLTDRHSPLVAVVVVRLADAPPAAALRTALAGVRERHPMLRFRLCQ